MSVLTVFKNTKLTPDKNFIIDDIGGFISTYYAFAINDFRYTKHDLQITINLDLEAATNLNYFKADNYNYVSIKNPEDTKPIYYFVMDKQYLANNTLKLFLEMDTLNTFNGQFDFNKKTTVYREHKDRVYNAYTSIQGKKNYYAKIDTESEGIEATLYKKSEKELINNLNQDWYLLYMANNTTGAVEGKDYPIDAYLISGEQVTVGIDVYRLKASSLAEDKAYFFGSIITGSYSSNDYMVLPDGKKIQLSGAYLITKVTGKNYWAIVQCLGENKTKFISYFSTYIDFSTIHNLTITKLTDIGNILTATISALPGKVVQYSTGTIAPLLDGTEGSISGIDTVDRTDTRLLSIFKLPYAPVNITIQNDKLLLPAEIEKSAALKWQNEQTYYYLKIKINYLNAFENLLSFNNITPFSELYVNFDTTDLRNDNNETKMLHSDFHQNRIVYDSFVYAIQDELIDYNYFKSKAYNEPLKFNFVTTSTINSRFLFDFSKFLKYSGDKIIQDYPYILTIARNNEIPTFNSDYINYKRNGYNYDVKNKNTAQLTAGLNIVGSALGLSSPFLGQYKYIPGVAGGTREGPSGETYYTPPQKAGWVRSGNGIQATALTLAFSNIASIANSINSIVQAERTFQQKQEEMKMSSVSISGSDDIDLLSYYSNNRAKYTTYEVSNKMRGVLVDLFYYQGYKCNEQKVPNVNTRKDFNFLQCNAVLENYNNIDRKYIDDIVAKFSIGVTYIHKRNYSWDIDQVKANNEIFVS